MSPAHFDVNSLPLPHVTTTATRVFGPNELVTQIIAHLTISQNFTAAYDLLTRGTASTTLIRPYLLSFSLRSAPYICIDHTRSLAWVHYVGVE